MWDTAITVRALAASGVQPENPALREAVGWLLARQIKRRGDWTETVDAEPGGWCFEYANDFYPDCDDTAMVLMALQTQFSGPAAAGALAARTALEPATLADAPQRRRDELAAERNGSPNWTTPLSAIDRGLRWLLAMQNRDGGWGAFDRNNNREFLCHVPFADHNAMIDPSTPDLAGRVLEALGQLGRRLGDPAVDRAVAYVRRTQNADGSWFGRWGVNYIYGTWQAITGLVAVGVPADDPAMVAGANWLLVHQQACGGWGESPDSYESPASSRPRPADGLANGLGAAGPAGRRNGATIRPSPAASATCVPCRTTTARGTKPSSPAPVSRGCSTCDTTIIPSISRCLALSQWAVKVEPVEKTTSGQRPAGRTAVKHVDGSGRQTAARVAGVRRHPASNQSLPSPCDFPSR